MNNQLCNHHALSLSCRLVDVVRPALREEEVRICHDEFFALVREERAALLAVAALQERRLNATPSDDEREIERWENEGGRCPPQPEEASCRC